MFKFKYVARFSYLFSSIIIIISMFVIQFLMRYSGFDDFVFISTWTLMMSIPISILIIFIFKKVLRTDLPFEDQRDLNKHDLYIFMQNKREIEDSFSYKGTGEKRPGYVVAQVKEISANFSKMGKDLLFTEYGELIVSVRALNVFKENKLTGYKTKSVIDKKSKQKSDSYFQLITDELMPLSSKTEFKKGLFGSILIAEDRAYYDKNILTTAADFNRTTEYLGDVTGFPYYHQRLWIVTRKVRSVFISEFNRNKNEFIPVYLVDVENYELEK